MQGGLCCIDAHVGLVHDIGFAGVVVFVPVGLHLWGCVAGLQGEGHRGDGCSFGGDGHIVVLDDGLYGGVVPVDAGPSAGDGCAVSDHCGEQSVGVGRQSGDGFNILLVGTGCIPHGDGHGDAGLVNDQLVLCVTHHRLVGQRCGGLWEGCHQR